MLYARIENNGDGGINLIPLKKEEVESLNNSFEKGKWWVLSIGKGRTHRNTIRLKDMPKYIQRTTAMAINVSLTNCPPQKYSLK